MSIIIILLVGIGIFFLLKGLILFLKALWFVLKAAYYKWFASERQIDEGYKKEVLAKEQDYKQFSKDLDNKMKDFLNN